jgi:hypothetical protein
MRRLKGVAGHLLAEQGGGGQEIAVISGAI